MVCEEWFMAGPATIGCMLSWYLTRRAVTAYSVNNISLTSYDMQLLICHAG